MLAWEGSGLVDLDGAAFWTGRTRKSLQRLYERGKLKPVPGEFDERGRVMFSFEVICKLGAAEEPTPGRPAQLLAAAIPDLLEVA